MRVKLLRGQVSGEISGVSTGVTASQVVYSVSAADLKHRGVSFQVDLCHSIG